MTANSQRKSRKSQLVASAPYEPTAQDARAVEAFQARQEQVPANVNLKLMLHEEQGPAFSVDYPDQGTGRVHLMTALGVTDTQLCNKLLIDIGNLAVCQGKHASEVDLNDCSAWFAGLARQMRLKPCSPYRWRPSIRPVCNVHAGWPRH